MSGGGEGRLDASAWVAGGTKGNPSWRATVSAQGLYSLSRGPNQGGEFVAVSLRNWGRQGAELVAGVRYEVVGEGIRSVRHGMFGVS